MRTTFGRGGSAATAGWPIIAMSANKKSRRNIGGGSVHTRSGLAGECRDFAAAQVVNGADDFHRALLHRPGQDRLEGFQTLDAALDVGLDHVVEQIALLVLRGGN